MTEVHQTPPPAPYNPAVVAGTPVGAPPPNPPADPEIAINEKVRQGQDRETGAPFDPGAASAAHDQRDASVDDDRLRAEKKAGDDQANASGQVVGQPWHDGDNVARAGGADPQVPVIGQPWPENAIPDPKAHAHPSETVTLHRITVAAMKRFSDNERVRFVRMLRDTFGG